MAIERLQKILARGGVASRRAAERMITDGRVRVNGRVVTELGAKADTQTDRVEIDGQKVVSEQAVYVILHKPRGVVATMSDPEGRPTVKELLKDVPGRVYPVGRLDFATSGVLLATNDGDFAEGLMHPKKAVPKTYVLKVAGTMQKDDIEKWRTGVRLEDGMTLPADAAILRHEGDKTWMELTIREGRNQQIRRMGEATHFPVMRLARVSFAGVTAEGLRPGQWRVMTRDELQQLKKEYGVPKRMPGPIDEAAIGPGRRVRKPVSHERPLRAPEARPREAAKAAEAGRVMRERPERERGPDTHAKGRGRAGGGAGAGERDREREAAPAFIPDSRGRGREMPRSRAAEPEAAKGPRKSSNRGANRNGPGRAKREGAAAREAREAREQAPERGREVRRGPSDRGARSGPPERGARSGPSDRGARSGPPERGARSGPPERGARSGPSDRGARSGPPDRGARSGPSDRGARSGPPERGDRRGPPARGGRGAPPDRGGRAEAGGDAQSPRFGGGSPGRRPYDVKQDWGGGAGRGRTGSDRESGETRGGAGERRGSSGGPPERRDDRPPRGDVGGRGGSSRTTGSGGGIGASRGDDFKMRGGRRR